MSVDRIPLNYLRVFDCAGKHLSFKLAAEDLNITPPAVSHQIKALEQQLGIQLFVRNNRKLCFTLSGKEYWQHVHECLSQLEFHTRNLKAGAGKRTLRATVIPPLASSLIIPNLSKFQERHPDVLLHVDSNAKQISFEDAQVDIAIRYGKGDWPNLVCEPLLNLYFQPVYPKKFVEMYDFSDEKSIAAIPLIHDDSNPDAWDRWFRASGKKYLNLIWNIISVTTLEQSKRLRLWEERLW